MRKRGRPSTPIGDLVAAAVITAIENDVSRDALSDRDALRRSGIFNVVPSPFVLRRAMQTLDLRDALREVLNEIAKHVYGLERWFSVDGTYLKTPFYRPMIKVTNPDGVQHWKRSKSACLIVFRGLKTGVPVAVHVENENASEGSHFQRMFEDMMSRGAIVRGGGVLADKAYNERSNFELVAKYGGRAFLDIDANAVSSRGKYPHFDEQFDLYKTDKDAWGSFYDYRPLSETTNHAIKSIKRVIRAQTVVARENEALALVVGYAISRLPELRLVHGIALPFLDAPALAFIDSVIYKTSSARLGPEELRIERSEDARTPAFERASIRGDRVA